MGLRKNTLWNKSGGQTRAIFKKSESKYIVKCTKEGKLKGMVKPHIFEYKSITRTSPSEHKMLP